MRLTILIPLFAFTFVLHLAATAAVPLKWTVETSRATPAQFEAYQGETLALEADLKSYGKPLEASGIAALYWQTNGMGSAYWEATAAVNSNRLSAVWTPEMDVGAKSYNCFIGVPGTVYHAAFQLRLRPSPGADPNTLPLPVPVIDFAKVRVLNPPWEGGGGGGVNTNAVIDIIHKTVDGAARPLPPYLHALDFDDSYPDAAADYYAQRQGGGAVQVPQCSAVRSGNFLSRNFDYPFDDRAEFIVRMSAGTVPSPSSATGAGKHRFASIGVANVGTNLTESFVTSGKPSRWYKALPGATVDGINENGVVSEINVVDGDPQTSGWHTTGDLHPLAAVRWALDHATNAQHAATYLAANIRFPEGWQQNFHYMVADETSTYIVENGSAHTVPSAPSRTGADQPVLTNFRLYPTPSDGEGQERYIALTNGANITSQWWTLTYTADGYRASDLPGITGEDLTQLFDYWASKPREAHRGETLTTRHQPLTTSTWWQTVHTSVYDITNRVLRIAVQETDDWYTFQVPSASDAALRRTVGALADSVTTLSSSVSGLESSKLSRLSGRNAITWNGNDLSIIANGAVRANTPSMLVTGTVDADEVTCGDPENPDILSEKLNKSDVIDPASATATGKAADALKVKQALASKRGMTDRKWYELRWSCTFSGYRAEEAEAYGFYVQWSDIDGGWCVYSPYGSASGPKGTRDSTELTWGADENWEGAILFGVSMTARLAPVETTDTLALSSDIPAPYTPSSSDPAFSNAVLSVGIDTNVLAAVASSTNAVAQIGEFYAAFSDIGLTPTQGGMTLAGLLAALVAAVTWLKKVLGKVADNSGEPTNKFATELMEKQVAKTALMIPLEAKTDSFAAEDGHAYAVTMTGTVTITMPTTTAGKAAIFQARFSAAAQQSVEFSTTALVKFDGADCGIVKAGKDALLSAMWNGEAWDLVWKNEA